MMGRIKHQDADYTRKTQEIAPLRNVIQKWNGYLTQTGQAPDYAFDLLDERRAATSLRHQTGQSGRITGISRRL